MRISTTLREHSKTVRKHATAAMKAGGATESREYARNTNIIYQGVLGTDANGLRRRHGLKKSQSIRDHLSPVDLALVMTTEAMLVQSAILEIQD